MSKPFIHAKSSAKRFGGIPSDYIEIHNFLDSSKSVTSSQVHRAITHTTWFISNVIERVFGITIKNSNGREVSTREIAEQHVFEDYRMKFIPSASDFLDNMEVQPWMMNGLGTPPSVKNVKKPTFKLVKEKE